MTLVGPELQPTITAAQTKNESERKYCADTNTPNDEVERRAVAPAKNEAALSQTSIPSLAHRRRNPAIARTDC